MVHNITLLLALLTSGVAGPFSGPTVGTGCYQSQFVLGTSNVPVSSGRATTIVNIWVVLKPKDDVPLAWVYKNASGQFWIQANNRRASTIRRAFRNTIADTLLTGSSARYLPVPQRMQSLSMYDPNFARVDASRQDCFTGDLSSKYY